MNSKQFLLSISMTVFFLLSTASSVFAETPPRTSTLWISTNNDGIDVIPYVRKNTDSIIVDFENWNDNIAYVYYNLNYINKKNGVKGGVEGSFINDPRLYSGSYNNKDYIRRELLFGSCSKNVCVYAKPKNVTLTVNTKMLTGQVDQYTKVLNFPDDQF